MLLALFAATSVPELDRQGFTPYGYGVDVPVTVRRTVSYGRGWQLLRSRGEDSYTTGPCDPPQRADSCDCAAGHAERDDTMPSCAATSLCDNGGQGAPGGGSSAAIVLVLDANASRLRFYFGKDTRKAYTSQAGLLMRLLLSLRAVNTTLPIFVLVSGDRFPAAEKRLAALGATLLPPDSAPELDVKGGAVFASGWAQSSFAKLRVLALEQFAKLIVMDNDAIVLRNIDHLASVPAPAFVFGYKCYPRRELRAALMVLAPSRAKWARASELMRDPATLVYDDGGEQSVWRRLYASVHELPAGYAALRSADFSAAEWRHVHVLHDPNLLRKAGRDGWKEASMADVVKRLDVATQRETSRRTGGLPRRLMPLLDTATAKRVATLGRTRQLMCHLHIPKSGGTALNHWLIDSFCPCSIDWGRTNHWMKSKRNPCSCPHVDAMGTTTRRSGDLEHSGFSRTSEHCASVAHAESWSPAAILTIREPISRMMSQWRHCANEFSRDLRPRCSHAQLRRPRVVRGAAWHSPASFAAFWERNHVVLTNFQTHWMTDKSGPANLGANLGPPNVSLALQRLTSAWLVAPTDQLVGLKACILRYANGSQTRRIARRSTDVPAGARQAWASASKAQAQAVASFLGPLGENGTALMRSIVAATRLDQQLYMRSAATFSRRCGDWVTPRAVRVDERAGWTRENARARATPTPTREPAQTGAAKLWADARAAVEAVEASEASGAAAAILTAARVRAGRPRSDS